MDLSELLRTQAHEIASSGHAGWGNTMVDAAAELDRLRAERDVLREALQYLRAVLPADKWADDARRMADAALTPNNN